MTTILDLLTLGGAFALLLVVASGVGSLAAPAAPLSVRVALGLALSAQLLFLLALAGLLIPIPMMLLALLGVAGAVWRVRVRPRALALAALALLPLFLLAAFPPLAFDETLYHLPFVHALVASGRMRFLPVLRFPVFPQLHELLAAPLARLAGDSATHLVALAETCTTAALLYRWGSRHHARAGLLAAALFLGSPLVVHLATILYVDAALTLFVVAGFFALDRALTEPDPQASFVLAGVFLGTACGVKYLAVYFVAAAFVLTAILAAQRLRALLLFSAACVAAALPTTLWLVATTGNPLFPYAERLFGTNPWVLWELPALPLAARLLRIVRMPWDVTFARDRIGRQPPVTPLLIPMIVALLAASWRDRQARALSCVAAVYVVLFAIVLPQDSRYLVPLLPPLAVVAAVAVARRWPRAANALALLAVLPGLAYACYRVSLLAPLPVTAAERRAWNRVRIPEYAALERAGSDAVYTCGGEQLQGLASGPFFGDFAGLYAYRRFLEEGGDTKATAGRLRTIGARYLLVAKRNCEPLRAGGGLTLVYEDRAAQLWRVLPAQPP